MTNAAVQCLTCLFEQESGVAIDDSKTNVEWAEVVGVNEASIRRHKNHREPAEEIPVIGTTQFGQDKEGNYYGSVSSTESWGYNDFREFIRAKGLDPDTVDFAWGVTSNPGGGYWNKLNHVRPKGSSANKPEWPVIQPAQPVVIQGVLPASRPARGIMKLSLKAADTQVGFRALPDGTYEAFHDREAMDLFLEVCRREQPESIILLGDLLDLPSQGKYAQEAGFARTTQMALDELHEWLSCLVMACPDSYVVIIEGNHDKRMQNFIEQNALAAFGLRRAGLPEEWPVMSLQYLLRLDELGIEYQDAYPAAVYWDDERTRNIHGTRANSKGSTMAQYSNDLPHVNTWAGHTHRTEIIFKTVIGPWGDPIESYSANPGCLCKTDGTVPSVHGALHSDGTSAHVVEDWQQGFGALLYDGKGESWPQVYRIKNGTTVYHGEVISL